MTLNEMRDAAYQNAKNKGFHEGQPDIPKALCLIHSEVSEALEADREGKHVLEYHYSARQLVDGEHAHDIDPEDEAEEFKHAFQNSIKNTFADELADVLIRVGDLCGALGIDIEAHVAAKMRYNQMREHKHGKSY